MLHIINIIVALMGILAMAHVFSVSMRASSIKAIKRNHRIWKRFVIALCVLALAVIYQTLRTL